MLTMKCKGLFLVMAVALLAGLASGEALFRSETGRIAGLDPARVMDVPSVQAVSKVYEGLIQYAYLSRPYRLDPCLAEGLPTVSSNGLDYSFRIRKGIYFQDDPCFVAGKGEGRELTAEDFVYSIKRIADPKVGSSGYWAFRGRIKGLDDYREAMATGAATYDSPVEGLYATDRHTFRLRLTQPFPGILWILAMNYAYAVPREAVEYYRQEFINHPVGTGPYVLKSYVHNYRIEFVRNPKWMATGRMDRYPSSGEAGDAASGLLADAGQPIPFIDRIVQYAVGDPSSQWLMFLANELDLSTISRDNWDAVIVRQDELSEGLAGRGVVMDKAPALDTGYIGFNMDDPVVGANRSLRQAMTAAFDREEWVRFQNGRVMPADGPVPPAMRRGNPGKTMFPFDVERARALMVAAGYPGGRDSRTGRRLELTLELGGGGSDTRETAEVLASFMERIGVVIKPSFNNWPAFLKKLEQRQAQMFLLTWMADYPDPENFLQLFYGPNETPGANRCNYKNAAFDRLYEKAAGLADGTERDGVYAGMERVVMEDCPWLFMHHSMTFSLRQGRLANYKPHDFPYGMIKYYRVMDASLAPRMSGETRP
jgi:oligopeptide transport system substrate-binding protein